MQIIATETSAGHYVVETTDRINGQIQKITLSSEADMHHIAQYWNRLYISEKITNWLHQRIHALSLGAHHSRQLQAEMLLIKVKQCDKSSVRPIRNLIADNEEVIRVIAPSERSGQYPYYRNVIISIVSFCKEMKGNVTPC